MRCATHEETIGRRGTRNPMADSSVVITKRPPFEPPSPPRAVVKQGHVGNSRPHLTAMNSWFPFRKVQLSHSSNDRCYNNIPQRGFNVGKYLVLAAAPAMVAERLACLPPTKSILVQSPGRSLGIFACGNRAGRCRYSAGFLGDLPFPPPFYSGAAPYSHESPSPTLKTSILMASYERAAFSDKPDDDSHDSSNTTLNFVVELIFSAHCDSEGRRWDWVWTPKFQGAAHKWNEALSASKRTPPSRQRRRLHYGWKRSERDFCRRDTAPARRPEMRTPCPLTCV
ncbi:hypothetical protein PR048_024270 [Dryococelus australis]|uniref:Uncharacterized protein n=1 Tax=Dryococelus australis TaxID=614101 RepID=A0ABQ9GN42_9NEOP|nr:hypothetical protein PR048_024270 [Dryococelus australis]